ncbi:hypothetical protein BN59_01694 [Legionella massiliensis]|uniref:Uncharacterized protein n=1 Tax=Legionella massiliensis TaxID=1034943 RepID=A0A078KWT6_9GAMM|nr:hypothetical protein BN59_01694 [Legionella massiliensis]CEE13149.1 hypothetical protein BN1094_01694 [Legionella massiliensis]
MICIGHYARNCAADGMRTLTVLGDLFGMVYSKEVGHVERSETSPGCGIVQIPEMSRYVRDDGGAG